MAVVVTPMSGRGDCNARWARDEGASPREDEHERHGARIVRLLWSKDKAGIPRMLVRGVPRRGECGEPPHPPDSPVITSPDGT